MVALFFISALYGPLHFKEHIQNYAFELNNKILEDNILNGLLSDDIFVFKIIIVKIFINIIHSGGIVWSLLKQSGVFYGELVYS